MPKGHDNYTTKTRSIPITATEANIPSIAYNDSNNTAAKLSFACGVSVDMDYSSGGSGISSHSVVATAFENKFGYTSATHRTTIYHSTLQKNMQNAQPAVLGIKKNNGDRHSIVCDGYKSTTHQYHLNYGWGTNGQFGTPSTWWYTLPSEMPDGYNDVFDGVLDIKPPASGTLGGNDYCRDYGLCSEGQGDCDPGQCQSGLTCVENVGPNYGWSSETDVCEKSTGGGTGTPGGNSYCTTSNPCSAGQGDCDSNAECESGLKCVDNVGAAYSYRSIVEVCERTSGGTPGANNYCTKYGPCSAGQGDCDKDSDCQSGLKCVDNVGPNYGWSSATDVCEKSTGVGNLKAYVTNWNVTTLVSGATVTVAGKSATTGSGGYVTITGIAAGTKTITISYGGDYGSSSVNIVAGTTVSYYFPLGWVY